MKKPSIKEIKYIGMVMGQDVWGNDSAIKMIELHKTQLETEMDKNRRLEIENFELSVEKKSFWRLFK